jgi:hypothetical protein
VHILRTTHTVVSRKVIRAVAQVVDSAVPGLGKEKYADSELVSVHMNLPKILWQAVDGLSKFYGTTKTNVVVRALNKEAFFARVLKNDPKAQIVIEHSNGEKERVVFV